MTHPTLSCHKQIDSDLSLFNGRRKGSCGSFFAVAFAVSIALVHSSAPIASAQNGSPSVQEWGVVLGADKNQQQAMQEVARNARILGQSPRLYLCNGWIRTVAAYRSRQDALKALRKVRAAGSKYSPYIVSLWQWCPGKKRI